MKKENGKKSRRKLYILITVLVLVAAFAAYLMTACLPYSGTLTVSAQTADNFSADNYYGNADSGERVMMLDDAQEAFYYRLGVVSRAESEIQVALHTIAGGNISDIFMGALLSAADRGVKITILTDAKMGKLTAEYKYALTAHENIEFYEYCPLNFFRPVNVPLAMHDKYLIADSAVMIFGGRNVGEKYFAEGDKEFSYDREVLITSSGVVLDGSIGQTKEYFSREIADSLSVHRTEISKSDRRKAQNEHNRLTARFSEYTAGTDYGSVDYAAITVPAKKITLVANPLEGAKKEPVIAYTLLQLLKNSKKTIIQSPFVVLSKESRNIFAEAIKDKDVTLLTNSLATTPNLPAFSNYTINRKEILATGVKVYEYQGAASLHSKTFIFDDSLTAIGSFNLDERSIRVETESMLIIDSPEFNAITQEVVGGYINQSLYVKSDGTYEDNGAVAPKEVPWFKSVLYTLAGYLLTPINYLL